MKPKTKQRRSLPRMVSTPVTESLIWKNACAHDSVKFCAMVECSRHFERESAFYRKLLEQICLDPRRTTARRLAESGLCFWDALREEKRNRDKARDEADEAAAAAAVARNHRANDQAQARRASGVDCK